MLLVFSESAVWAVLLATLGTMNAQVAPDAVITQVITEKSLSMRYEIEAAEAAIDACAANQVHATVVIVDARGNTRLQMVGDRGRGMEQALLVHLFERVVLLEVESHVAISRSSRSRLV